MKKFLCVLLSLVIVISLFVLPFSALAAGSQENNDINSFIDGITELSREYDAEKNFEIKEDQIMPFSMDGNATESLAPKYTDLDFQTARLIVRANGKFDTFGAKEHISGFEDFHILQYGSPEAAMSAFEKYKTMSEIKNVAPDIVVDALQDEDSDSEFLDSDIIKNQKYLCEWGHDRTQADRLLEYIETSDIQLKDVIVGIVDSGVDYNHEFLEKRIVRTYFNSSSDGTPNDEMDCEEAHGTAVSSVVVDYSPKNVKVAVYKILNSQGWASVTQVCAGFLQAIADGVDVINASIGFMDSSGLVVECVLKAYSNNIPLFTAAGNAGKRNIYELPANVGECITVSATDADNTTVKFNSLTPKSDISAPGDNVAVIALNNTYRLWSGTSFASPCAAALGAILKSFYPKITIYEIESQLKNTSFDVKRYGEYESSQGSNMDNYYSLHDGVGMIQFCDALDLENLAAPELNLKDEVYEGEQFCEISCSDGKATILYTTDGTYPALENATVYAKPFKITKHTRIRTVAYYADGGYYSNEVEATPRIHYTDSDENFVIDEDGIIKNYKGTISNLYVPEKINGITVKGFVKSAFNNNTLIGLMLPKTVTEIPQECFYKNTSLEFIRAEGVTDIGAQSFGNSQIMYAEFPAAKKIGNSAFENTSRFCLGDFSNLEDMGKNAFAYSTIISFNCPSVKALYNRSFVWCERLESVYLPQCTEIIFTTSFEGTFYECSRLVITEIPLLQCTYFYATFYDTGIIKADFQSIEQISPRDFYNCYLLEIINMPSLLSVPEEAFSGSNNSDGTNPRFYRLDSVRQIEEDAFGKYKTSRIEFSHLETAQSLPQTENCIIAMPSTFKECTENTEGRKYIVYGTKDTYAEQWANENGHEFIEVLQETALFQDVPMEYTGKGTLTVDVIGFNRTYQWYSNTEADNTTGTPIEGATNKEFNPADYPDAPYYYCVVTSTDVGYDPVEIRTGVTANKTYSETILNPMSSQIRFQRNDNGSYANKFDIRTRAEITDEDFAKYIAETNEEAVKKISKVGFVYYKNSTDFSIADAQKVAMGEKVSGYVDAPVNYIQDADGYYMFTCIITDIPLEDVGQSVTAYAYICVEDKWYFYNAETTTVFKDLYDANYSQAATTYGW